jgi:serine/threonine-protein phosphatase 2A regulatory subunit B'
MEMDSALFDDCTNKYKIQRQTCFFVNFRDRKKQKDREDVWTKLDEMAQQNLKHYAGSNDKSTAASQHPALPVATRIIISDLVVPGRLLHEDTAMDIDDDDDYMETEEPACEDVMTQDLVNVF